MIDWIYSILHIIQLVLGLILMAASASVLASKKGSGTLSPRNTWLLGIAGLLFSFNAVIFLMSQLDISVTMRGEP